MMSFNEFCDSVVNNMAFYMPKKFQNMEINIQHPSKVNYGTLTALTFREPSSSMGPVIYLDDKYKGYVKENKPMEDVMKEIASQVVRSFSDMPDVNKMASSVLDVMSSWEKAKEHVYPYAIGAERNKALLKNTPHKTMGDISCVFRVRLYEGEDQEGSVLIDDEKMTRFGVNKNELFSTAAANMLKNDPPFLIKMEDVFKPNKRNFLSDDKEIDISSDDIPLFILTDERMSSGAVDIFLPGILEKIQKKFPDGFVVLPSSIHEVLILPDPDKFGDADSLVELIKGVNSSAVDKEEQLSDKPHYYDAEKKALYCKN